MIAACASFERPIDLVHLARQTLGDRTLEREILTLFVRQSVMLNERLAHAMAGNEKRDLAHTLKGSALAVGAWRVARAAENVENLLIATEKPGDAHSGSLVEHMRVLAQCIDEANGVIADLTPDP